MTKVEKQRENYKNYIDTHRANVVKAWEMIKRCCEFTPGIVEKISANVEAHDLSKYGVEEFEPYRRKYWPTDEEEITAEVDSEYDVAWIHHKQHNPHHWETLVNKPWNNEKMAYTIEGVADWIAMAIYFKNPVRKWWIENRQNVVMEERQLQVVDYIYDSVESSGLYKFYKY